MGGHLSPSRSARTAILCLAGSLSALPTVGLSQTVAEAAAAVEALVDYSGPRLEAVDGISDLDLTVTDDCQATFTARDETDADAAMTVEIVIDLQEVDPDAITVRPASGSDFDAVRLNKLSGDLTWTASMFVPAAHPSFAELKDVMASGEFGGVCSADGCLFQQTLNNIDVPVVAAPEGMTEDDILTAVRSLVTACQEH